MNLNETWYQIVITVGIGFLAAAAWNLLERIWHILPTAYNVAVVGFPRSGKTMLITAAFAQMFSDRYLNNRVILRTKQTIERVNRDLERISMGKSLGPTTDQDLFAYRADIRRGFFPFLRTYKVEIGDFPGEDSIEFAEKYGKWLHETAYFKWVMEADAFIFVIDLALVLADKNPPDYKATMTSAIRAAWQHLVEYHVEGKKNLRRKPVLLVFTKADLLIRKRDLARMTGFENEVMKIGFGDELPPIIRCTKEEIDYHSKSILGEYSEIVSYLESQTTHFSYHFVSLCAQDENGRLGIQELVRKILPR